MIFGGQQRATPEVIEAMQRTARLFAERWHYESPPDAEWVATWADLLHDLTPEEIDTAAGVFLKEFRSPPLPCDFVEARNRIHSGQKLDDPYVSHAERIAFMILTSEEFVGNGVGHSDLANGCLIAATIANWKAHQGLGIEDHPALQEMLASQLRLIGRMREDWVGDAREGKGYWKGIFDPKHSTKDVDR